MGRIKRGYVREIPSDELKRDYRLFAIACEGSKREKEYFQQLEGISSRVVVEYIEDQEYEKDPPSSPQHVLRRAIEYAESNALNDEDSVWLVMDVDRWGGKALNEVNEECKQRQDYSSHGWLETSIRPSRCSTITFAESRGRNRRSIPVFRLVQAHEDSER